MSHGETVSYKNLCIFIPLQSTYFTHSQIVGFVMRLFLFGRFNTYK